MKVGLKNLRESSSLILVAKTAFAPNISQDYNYKLLTIKRSSRSDFFPNTHVFPGGNASVADKSRDWLKLYEKFGFKWENLQKLNYDNKLPILKNDDNEAIPKFLSLRICAIRETFEECGILICRSYKINYKERVARWATYIGGPEIKKWQDTVHDDPNKFLELCNTFEIYPDVWALKDWSNWVTPASLPKRFDTIFFLASFQQTPEAFAEKQEVQHLEWDTPKGYITKSCKDEIALPPPQFYEISRLGNFQDVDYLSKFANERSKKGLERFLPLRVTSNQGIFSILPGDDLYPAEVNPDDETIVSYEDLPDSHVQNRILSLNPFSNKIIVKNFLPKYNHCIPIDFTRDSKSKL